MSKFIAVLTVLIFPLTAFSYTEVSGDQSGVWTSGGSPYLVIGEIVVPAGLTLTIEPGIEVNFQGHFKFTVNGNLQAVGTEADSIFFTTDDQTTGWGGVRIDSDDVCALSFCRIEFGRTSGSYPDIHGGGLALLSSDAVVANSAFANNDATGNDNGMGGAVYAYNTGSQTAFTDCLFIGNHAYGEGGAIKFTGDLGSEITGCEFLENDCLYGGGAISCYMAAGTKLTYCLFVDNYTMYSNGGAINTLVDMNPDQYFGSAPDVGAFEYNGTGIEGSADPYRNGIGLYQNSPNPFHTETIVSYQLIAESYVSIKVYDLSGRSITTLVEAEEAAGSRSVAWNGRDRSGRRVPSGTYIIRLQIENDAESIKVLFYQGGSK
ncbi:MAG: T9SS type A sorting domain-containing protein [Candidatus Fermentibacteria bacterium]